MKKKTFQLTYPLSVTKDWAGQIKIRGDYWMDNGSLMCEVEGVFHSSSKNPSDSEWRWIPNTFWTWLENGSDRICEIAFEHCKGLMQANAPDVTTDMQQEHIIQIKKGLS